MAEAANIARVIRSEGAIGYFAEAMKNKEWLDTGDARRIGGGNKASFLVRSYWPQLLIDWRTKADSRHCRIGLSDDPSILPWMIEEVWILTCLSFHINLQLWIHGFKPALQRHHVFLPPPMSFTEPPLKVGEIFKLRYFMNRRGSTKDIPCQRRDAPCPEKSSAHNQELIKEQLT